MKIPLPRTARSSGSREGVCRPAMSARHPLLSASQHTRFMRRVTDSMTRADLRGPKEADLPTLPCLGGFGLRDHLGREEVFQPVPTRRQMFTRYPSSRVGMVWNTAAHWPKQSSQVSSWQCSAARRPRVRASTSALSQSLCRLHGRGGAGISARMTSASTMASDHGGEPSCSAASWLSHWSGPRRTQS